jgi:hypothetical protein
MIMVLKTVSPATPSIQRIRVHLPVATTATDRNGTILEPMIMAMMKGMTILTIMRKIQTGIVVHEEIEEIEMINLLIQ